MSSALQQVITQLTWKKNDLLQQLNHYEQKHSALAQHIKQLDTKNQHATAQEQTTINPELEMNRLHFLMQLQEQKIHMQQKAEEQLHRTTTLGHQIQRIKMELLMLERYGAQHQQNINREQQKTMEHQLEEWVLQRRGRK